MGQIVIAIEGSFVCKDRRTFSAMKSGHTVTLEDAIEWLEEKIPSAISQDERLRKEGSAPGDDWERFDKRTVSERESKERQVVKKNISTTIGCPKGTLFGGDCCGCITGMYNEKIQAYIFRCSECGEEVGSGGFEE